MTLNPQQLQAWAMAGGMLINGGVAAASQIAALIRLFHPTITEEELNATVQTVIADATRRKALAEQEAQG